MRLAIPFTAARSAIWMILSERQIGPCMRTRDITITAVGAILLLIDAKMNENGLQHSGCQIGWLTACSFFCACTDRYTAKICAITKMSCNSLFNCYSPFEARFPATGQFICGYMLCHPDCLPWIHSALPPCADHIYPAVLPAAPS